MSIATHKQEHTSEDGTLLVWGNALLVLDLGLHVIDGIEGRTVMVFPVGV